MILVLLLLRKFLVKNINTKLFLDLELDLLYLKWLLTVIGISDFLLLLPYMILNIY